MMWVVPVIYDTGMDDVQMCGVFPLGFEQFCVLSEGGCVNQT